MLLVGFSRAQIGEFSLITANVGFANGILSREIYQEFLAITVLSMVLTPFFMGFGYRSVTFSGRLPLPKILLYNRYGNFQEEEQEKGLENHMIIIGFGINGRNVSIAAKKVSIPYIITPIFVSRLCSTKKSTVFALKPDASCCFLKNMSL
jgi:CPA2 family monovalent cation:H+ antiporter-2